MNVPRQPNDEEINQLALYLLAQRNADPADAEEVNDAKEQVESASAAVFDHYITDCPGYAGKLMVVIWSGDPSFCEVFGWTNGKMICLKRLP